MEEVQKHNSEEDVWIVIGNAKTGGPKVYDVTKYLNDHPGGGEMLLDVAGQNADDMFEDVGHTSDARKTMKEFLIGKLELTPAEEEAMKQAALKAKEAKKNKGGLGMISVIILIIAIAAGYYFTQMQ
eukprot:CAMPEP_0117758472 /NCGR_PEP_ID=MMETSP0947-20121206/15401_1 /TAXON_ID=44440 /ORGANISM="Chattonella subsalsa, Strain CCMP2191" /LENGTH=126 /DNA_ID=CAMNT_0005578671 /DNA_START=139 /DNA_END=519 /DNA_ORIENTATION=+